MAKKRKKSGLLTKALLETADDMHRVGVMDAGTYEKITQRKRPSGNNLYERIRARLEPLGGADDLKLVPRLPDREPTPAQEAEILSSVDEARASKQNFLDKVLKGRVARPIEDLDAETLQAIALSVVPTEHAAFDDLAKDRKP
jgi:hypothetical protein